MKYIIDTNLDYDYQDVPPWRSYYAYGEMDILDNYLDEVLIGEIDQDGEVLNEYPLSEASNSIQKEVEFLIKNALYSVIEK